ncbi:hypothetical protein TNCT_312901 [Trichonephila clavata]|uniref:Uncharacterized protein n=1 Tax=Trichonephila clavata TaxID=2740835 RepID=A0A8X6KS18_TRICU|nr:hypothetical protein TNCT_312901 [Trichonephila clavata]
MEKTGRKSEMCQASTELVSKSESDDDFKWEEFFAISNISRYDLLKIEADRDKSCPPTSIGWTCDLPKISKTLEIECCYSSNEKKKSIYKIKNAIEDYVLQIEYLFFGFE